MESMEALVWPLQRAQVAGEAADVGNVDLEMLDVKH
jgi:hypothetical protein